MSFFVAYEGKDFRMVTENKEIAKNYLKKWFILDFISLIPFDEFLKG